MREFSPLWMVFLVIVLFGFVPVKVSAVENKLVLIWGDSLSAAYGINVEQGWVALLQARLESSGIAVVNGSVSGETTRGGLTRLPAALQQHHPSLVVLELGANDGLRALSLNQMRSNLQQMIDLSHRADAQVLLLGMKIPPNYGPAYPRQFEQVYAELAEDNGLAKVDFFLEGVTEDFSLMQQDNLHPNEKAQPMLLENVWPQLSGVLGIGH